MTMPCDSLIPWAPAEFSDLLVDLARQSLQLQNEVAPTCKADGSLVTLADTHLEDLIVAFLQRAEPQSFIIGEETLSQQGSDYLAAAMNGRTWVIDPIDGTALYALGLDGWGISVGLMEAGVLLQGVVAYPQQSIYGSSVEFLFSQESVVRQCEARLAVDTAVVMAELIQTAQPLRIRPAIPGYQGQISTSQRFAKGGSYAGRHQIICFASSVHTFRLLMSGSLVGYLVKLKLWDLAAVWPMAWRLGIRCCTKDGQPVDLKVSDLAWRTDSTDPQFLGLREHILFYWPDRLDPAVWKDFKLPPQ